MSIQKQLYLITGFLGAGKTTFLHQAIGMFPTKRVAILVNEFGKQGVDGGLLAAQGYEVTEINNGSIFCVCRMDMFIDALVAALRSNSGVLLVETSGLSNPANIHEVLAQTEAVAGQGFDYRGCICLIDAVNFERVAHTAVVVPDQIRLASLLVVNKIDLAEPTTLATLEKDLRALNPDAPLLFTQFARIPPNALASLSPAPQRSMGGKVDIQSASCTVRFPAPLSKTALDALLAAIAPMLYRCKGYVQTEDGAVFVDGVMNAIQTSPSAHAPSGLTLLYPANQPVRRTVRKLVPDAAVD
ncbi:MAG: GTP-binding protein [Oscillospiraceae bacterium]|nr:GTP-binding protein [Oscillospiraceae bacterium]